MELPYITRPIIGQQRLCGPSADNGRLLISFVVAVQKVIGQRENIALPFPQRRYGEGHHIEAIVQVGPKPSLFYQFLQGLIGGRHNSHIHRHVFFPPDFLNLPPLKHPQQLALHYQGHIPHLVQKEGTSLGQLKLAQLPPFPCPCKGALLIAEQLALNERLRDGSAVDRYKRPISSGTGLVNQLCKALLAHTIFPPNKHRRVGFGGGDSTGQKSAKLRILSNHLKPGELYIQLARQFLGHLGDPFHFHAKTVEFRHIPEDGEGPGHHTVPPHGKHAHRYIFPHRFDAVPLSGVGLSALQHPKQQSIRLNDMHIPPDGLAHGYSNDAAVRLIFIANSTFPVQHYHAVLDGVEQFIQVQLHRTADQKGQLAACQLPHLIPQFIHNLIDHAFIHRLWTQMMNLRLLG